MGFLDKFKAKAADAVDKHGDKISRGLDKAGDMADKRSKGQHHDKIATAKTKARKALDDLNRKKGDDTPQAPGTPPAPPPHDTTPPATGEGTPPRPIG